MDEQEQMKETPSQKEIPWNPQVKLIITDVDETIADNFTPATPEMIKALTSVLEEGKAFLFVSGASLARINSRIIDSLPANLRRQILVAHCSGAEVWGFDENGNTREKPFYSLYEGALTEEQKSLWREKVQDLIKEFHLKTYEPIPALEFKKEAGDDPHAVIIEDRGPQITLEVINGYDLSEEQAEKLDVEMPQMEGSYDFRVPIFERAQQVFKEAGIPITPRLAGTWAIDFAIEGVNKTTAVKYVIENEEILNSVGLAKNDLQDPSHLEVWEDKFSTLRGETDRHMSEALSKEVRSIDFRQENPEEFLEGYNTVVWNGKKHLQEGLLEFLQSRH